MEGGKSQGSFENIRHIYCVALPKAYKVLSWQFIFLAFRLLLAKARQFCKYHQGDKPIVSIIFTVSKAFWREPCVIPCSIP